MTYNYVDAEGKVRPIEHRQTPTERSHELLKLALERPAPVSGQPSFKVSQEKAVGGATVFTWDVHVPECDEYPTAEDAFEAAIGYAARLSKLFPPPNGGPDLAQALADSVPQTSPRTANEIERRRRAKKDKS